MDNILNITLKQLEQYMYEKNLLTEEIIKAKGLELFIPDICDDNKSRFRKIKTFYNTIKNKMKLDEIKKFSDFIHQNNIKAVVVKGITTVADVYDNISQRGFGDIDVYVYEDHIPQVLNFLSDQKFIEENTGLPVRSEWYMRYRGASTHLPPFVKTLICNGIECIIKYEIHLFPFFINAQYGFLQNKDIYENFFNNIVEREFFNIKLPVLDHTTNFLFLLDHFIKHICSSFEANIYEDDINCPFQIQLLKLVEAKVYYEKNKKDIHISDMMKAMYYYHNQYQIDLAVKIMNEIFPNTITDFESLSQNDVLDQLPENVMCRLFKNYEISTLIDANINIKKNIINMVYGDDKQIGCIIEVPNIQNTVCNTKSGYITIKHNNPQNWHKQNVMFGESYNEDVFSLYGYLRWDINYIYIDVEVTDLSFPEINGNIITFHVGNSKINEVLHGFHVRIFDSIQNEKYHFVDIDDGTIKIEEKYPETKFSYIATTGKGFSVSIALPFSAIGIKPCKDSKLYFDIELKKYDGDKLISNSSIGCIRETFSQKYGCLLKLY